MDLSTALTQCATIAEDYSSSNAKKDFKSKSTIVNLSYVLLKTISYYCKVCKSCILRDKDSSTLIAEYCKRVTKNKLITNSGKDIVQQ
jgi:predicted metal-binding transcription factor (methanogenesis marker protein 9)